MMDAIHAILEATDPERDCFRSYRIDAGTDLFGYWVVDVNFGRIGSRGRTVRYNVGDESSAVNMVRAKLKQRASAKRRIGIEYRLLDLLDN